MVVGVNRYRLAAEDHYQPLRVDPAVEESARTRLAALRSSRSSAAVHRALGELRNAATDVGSNVLYPMKRALAAHATVGEVCHALREVWGSYLPTETL